MKTICFLFISIIMLWVTFAGCDTDKENPLQQKPAFTMSEFPMDVYAKWRYSVHDTVADTYDTVDVFVFDSTRFPEEHYATVWLFSGFVNSYGRDCVSHFGDTLKFFHDRSGVADRCLVFPIEVGNIWEFDYNLDHIVDKVVGKENVETPYGEMSAYRIRSDTYSPILDQFAYSELWLVPDVGLVRAEYTSGFRVVERHEIWELLNYWPPKMSG
jgi:hypothetical protein